MMQLDVSQLGSYLGGLVGQPVTVVALQPLGEGAITAVGAADGAPQRLKMYGYGKPVLVRYRVGDEERRAVLHTVTANPFGHEYRADRAAGLLLSYDTFNTLPRHARALDVGTFATGVGLLSLRNGEEFFLLTEYVEGDAYAVDMQQLRDGAALTERDVLRARALAEYLARIHARKGADPVLYRRHVRDLIGGGEGIMGLADSYPPDFALASPCWLEQIERACVRWRWRLKDRAHRLAQIHGDFHPFNILFRDGADFQLLDRSRGGWGDPADDVSCLSINYLFFSLQRSRALAPPFTRLWDVFWETYLAQTDDDEIRAVIAPFFAWRSLVLASPLWYNLADSIRERLFRFVERVLSTPVFDPARVNEYLE